MAKKNESSESEIINIVKSTKVAKTVKCISFDGTKKRSRPKSRSFEKVQKDLSQKEV